MKPWMSPDDIAAIRRRLTPGTIALEWGAGGSTVEFSPLVKEWYTIEHDHSWAARVHAAAPSAIVRHVPCGVAQPVRPSVLAEWALYVEACRVPGKKFNFVLIDGRARPECAAAVLPLLAPGAVVAIHDWDDHLRPHYRRVLEQYRLLEEYKTVDRKLHGAGLAILEAR